MTAHLKPYFRGVFMRDTLPNIIRNKECGIVNLDTSSGHGTHWVAYYRNGANRIYFDSFGLDPPTEIQKYLDRPYLMQTFQLQNASDTICGHLCILVLDKLLHGQEFKNIILSLI